MKKRLRGGKRLRVKGWGKDKGWGKQGRRRRWGKGGRVKRWGKGEAERFSGRAKGWEKVANKRGRAKGGKRMGRVCGRIRERCHIYDILYSINLSIVSSMKKIIRTKRSLKCQTLNMQATYESSISCFNGKLLSLIKNIFKNVICCSILRSLVYEAEHDYFVLRYF